MFGSSSSLSSSPGPLAILFSSARNRPGRARQEHRSSGRLRQQEANKATRTSWHPPGWASYLREPSAAAAATNAANPWKQSGIILQDPPSAMLQPCGTNTLCAGCETTQLAAAERPCTLVPRSKRARKLRTTGLCRPRVATRVITPKRSSKQIKTETVKTSFFVDGLVCLGSKHDRAALIAAHVLLPSNNTMVCDRLLWVGTDGEVFRQR